MPWPYQPPRKMQGELLAENFCTYDCPRADLHGYSGAPVFADGQFVGMFVASNEDVALLIPASYIFALINFDHVDWLPPMSATEWNDGGIAPLISGKTEFREGDLRPRNALIVNLDAGKITTGELDVETLIVHGSLTAPCLIALRPPSVPSFK